MHDVVAGLEVVEEPARVAALRARPAVGAAATGEVGLGEDRERDGGQDEAVVERSDDDAAARAREVGVAVDVDREVEPDRQQQLVQPAGRAFGVGRDDDAVAARPSSSAMRRPSPSPSPTTGPQPVASTTAVSGRSAIGRKVQAPAGVFASRSSNGSVQARELGALRAPRLAQAAGEIGLLGEDLAGAVAHAAGLDEHDLRVGVERGRPGCARRW